MRSHRRGQACDRRRFPNARSPPQLILLAILLALLSRPGGGVQGLVRETACGYARSQTDAEATDFYGASYWSWQATDTCTASISFD
jgi:hypothetical protein